MKAMDRGWFEYEWRNSGEKDYYLKGKVVDYFESFDIHFSVTMKMDEFTAPTKVIRDTFLALSQGGLPSYLLACPKLAIR